MKFSYSSEDLIKEVREDISIFGPNMNVYAIYSYFGEDIPEFITDYIHADKPTREEACDEEDYQILISDYEKSIKSIEKTKHVKMSLKTLLNKLIEQDDIF